MSEDDELHKLPEHWAWSAMSKVCDKIQDGTHFSPDQDRQFAEGEYPYVTAKNVRRWGLDLSDISYLAEPDHRQIYQRCNPITGDVLLVKDGVNAGDAAINTFDGEISLLSSVCMLRPQKGILLEQFLRYFLLSPQGYRFLTGQMTGTAIKRIILRKVRETPVAIAPLNEQGRIVAKIEELFSDLDAGVAALQQVKGNLKRYRAAVLKAAVDGSLTAEWRAKHPNAEPASKLLERILVERRHKWEAEQLAKFKAAGKVPPKNWKDKCVEPSPPDVADLPELPECWCWASMEQLVARSEYGTSVKCDYSAHGVPVLRIPNIAAGSIDLSDIKYATQPVNLSDGDELLSGDMLMCRTNGSIGLIGKSAVLKDRLKVAHSFASYLLRFRFAQSSVLPFWVHAYVSSIGGRRFIEGNAASSAGQHNISLSLISRMPIPLPPTAEQYVLVDEINERLFQTEIADGNIAKSLLRAARLRQSILKQAFEGTLVPQDPKDEPASKLLERIKVQSAEAASNGKPAASKGKRSKQKAS
jgi:type I restriction enzyme S subunit